MYSEEEGAPPAADYPEYSGGFRAKISYHLEGLIPLILIVIIAVAAGAVMGWWEIPFLTKKPINLLIVGQPSEAVRIILDEDKDLVNYWLHDADWLKRNPKENLAQFDVVLLDQSNQAKKFLSRQAGEALQAWVKKGGKLITVKNSGIFREGATDIVGWRANIGDVVPVECTRLEDGTSSCTSPVFVEAAEIIREDFDHPIMEGIDVVPSLKDAPPLQLETFKVQPRDNEIAYIRNIDTGEIYPAIVERRLIWGKSIYFNYDPGQTRGLFEKTLEYLR